MRLAETQTSAIMRIFWNISRRHVSNVYTRGSVQHTEKWGGTFTELHSSNLWHAVDKYQICWSCETKQQSRCGENLNQTIGVNSHCKAVTLPRAGNTQQSRTRKAKTQLTIENTQQTAGQELSVKYRTVHLRQKNSLI